MRSEFERMQQRQPMDVLSMKRYELPPPPAGKMTDIAAWTECVENSMAQLEHQATRLVLYNHYLTIKILVLLRICSEIQDWKQNFFCGHFQVSLPRFYISFLSSLPKNILLGDRYKS